MIKLLKTFSFFLFTLSALPIVASPYITNDMPSQLIPHVKPVRTCESLAAIVLPNATIREAKVFSEAKNLPAWCRVTVTVGRPNTDRAVTIWVGLPLESWNGRFLGTGGGGYFGGFLESLALPVATGFVAAATDAGTSQNKSIDEAFKYSEDARYGDFALNKSGRISWTKIQNFAYAGIHTMTSFGKSLAEAFYGEAPKYAYFSGCSTGGRQAMMEAQRYPGDYDGILSGAPAINWPRLIMAEIWGQYVMLDEKNLVPQCKLDAATEAAVNACDEIDGVKDGVIGDPRRCKYNADALVGTEIIRCGIFTAKDANVLNKNWEGAHKSDGSFLWYGLSRGAPLGTHNRTEGAPIAGKPMRVAENWIKYFLVQNPDWNWKTLGPDTIESFWEQSIEQYSAVLATDNPDLSVFRDRGGKLLMWHGENDQIIPPEGSINYIQRVQGVLGGAKKTGSFIRLFMAPGVEHCGGGVGPMPTGMLDALLKWVEQGHAPERIMAIKSNEKTKKIIRSRPLCPYPQFARYNGEGGTDKAENFICGTKH